MKKLIKRWWVIVAYAIAILVVTLFLKAGKASPTVNNWVLAYSTITLVFVTIYYAIQTQRLVEQEQQNLNETIRRRDIDYLERRMNEFYGPFLEKLNTLRMELVKKPPITEKLNELSKDTQFFLWKKSYMISKETEKIIGKWQLDFFVAEVDRDKDAFRKFINSEREVREQVRSCQLMFATLGPS